MPPHQGRLPLAKSSKSVHADRHILMLVSHITYTTVVSYTGVTWRFGVGRGPKLKMSISSSWSSTFGTPAMATASGCKAAAGVIGGKEKWAKAWRDSKFAGRRQPQRRGRGADLRRQLRRATMAKEAGEEATDCLADIVRQLEAELKKMQTLWTGGQRQLVKTLDLLEVERERSAEQDDRLRGRWTTERRLRMKAEAELKLAKEDVGRLLQTAAEWRRKAKCGAEGHWT